MLVSETVVVIEFMLRELNTKMIQIGLQINPSKTKIHKYLIAEKKI